MRIGFDLSAVGPGYGGVARYATHLLRALRTYVPEHQYVVISDRPSIAQASGPPGEFTSTGPHFPVRAVWMHLLVPQWLRTAGLDLCHFTSNLAPLAAGCPIVLTVHDMSVFVTPGYHPIRRVLAHRTLVPVIAGRARAILTHSQASRDDLIRVLGITPARIHVVPLAPASEFARLDDGAELASVADRYQLAPGFVLHAGIVEPRKNLIRVVDAFHRLTLKGLRTSLVIVGPIGWKNRGLFERISELGIQERVRLTGPVPASDLVGLINLAGVVVYPSLYEGFGLPILEAMSCGAPVITSRGGATEEVAGEAAVLVDPMSSLELEDAISAVLSNSALRDTLRAAGLNRATQFSWERVARETAAVYAAVAGGIQYYSNF